MTRSRFTTVAEQVAAHLRGDLMRRRWDGELPGIRQLAGELHVNVKTVEVTLRQLERERLLVPQGAGRRRRIVLPRGGSSSSSLRVAILLRDQVADSREGYIVELQHKLVQAGHVAFHPPRSLIDLKMDVKRIARLVKQTEADAWVLCVPSREVAEWFAAAPVPAFAMFGRRRGLPLAATGPDRPPAYAAAARRLIELGHRRIVLLARRDRREPVPGAPERAFLAELAVSGIPVNAYNLPDWEESIDGYYRRLDLLFRITPPTALMIGEAALFAAAQQFLAARRLRVPRDVSLICDDPGPVLGWCRPSVAQVRWDVGPVVRRIVHWVDNVRLGKPDKRQTVTPAEFIDGGTVGPAPAHRR